MTLKLDLLHGNRGSRKKFAIANKSRAFIVLALVCAGISAIEFWSYHLNVVEFGRHTQAELMNLPQSQVWKMHHAMDFPFIGGMVLGLFALYLLIRAFSVNNR